MNMPDALLKSVTLSLAVQVAGCNAPLPVDDPCPECNRLDADCAKNAACSAAITRNMSCATSALDCEKATEAFVCKEYGNSAAVTGLRTWSDLINCVAICGGKEDHCAEAWDACEETPGCGQIDMCIGACKCAGVDDMGNGEVSSTLVGECVASCRGEPSMALTIYDAYFKCLFMPGASSAGSGTE